MQQVFFKFLYDEDVQNDLNKSHRVNFNTLLLVRGIMFILLTMSMVFMISCIVEFSSYWQYLTNWGAFTVYAYFYLVIIENIATKLNCNLQFFHDYLWKTTHLLFTIAFCLELPIVLIYWAYLYPLLDINTTNDWILNLTFHLLFFVFICIDMIINDVQFFKKHLHALMIVNLIYGVFNLFICVTQKKAVYPGITWTNFISYIILAVAFSLTIISFYLGYYYCKKYKIKLVQQSNLLSEI